MRETWYVLADGTYGDPADVIRDESGALRHKDGRYVAMRGDVPSTSGVDADVERAKAKPAPAAAPREMQPEPKPEPAKKAGYKTRKA